MSLPNGWAKATVGEVFQTAGGGTPSTEEKSFWGGKIPWISSADVGEGFDLRPRRFATEVGLANSPATAVPPESVVVVIRVGLGKVGLVKEQPLCFSQDSQALLPVEGLDSRFTAYQMKLRALNFAHQSRGTTISGITKKQLIETEFLVPPSREQSRIADGLDELLSDVEAGVSALLRVREKLKLYRASVLKAAVEGKLTAEWRAQHPNTEPASELLKRILTERRTRWEQEQLAKFAAKGKEPPPNWKAKYKEPVAPDTTKLPSLPRGWCWASISQLAAPEKNAITDGPFGSELKTDHYTDSGPRVVRLQNIKDGVFADEKAHISEERFAKLEKHRVFPGDIVIAALGDAPPRSCLIPDTLGPAIVKADCVRLKAHKELAAYCLNHFLNALPTKVRTKNLVHGVGRPRLNLDEIKSIVLPVPPAQEQQAIVEALEDQISIVEHVERDLDAKTKSTQTLRQAILRHAFNGQLVPHDPKDEPASELLKRIAAERERRAHEAASKRVAKNREGNGQPRHARSKAKGTT